MFELIFSVKDEKGKYSSTRLYLPTGTAWADVVGFAQEMAPLLEALITGQITRVGVAYSVDISGLGLRSAPLAGSDVEEGAALIYNAGDYAMRHRLPTIDESFIVAGTADVDTDDTDVAAFVDAMVAGLTPDATLVQPCEHRGVDISGLATAKESFQRSRG